MKSKAPPIPPDHHRNKPKHRAGDGTFKSPPESKKPAEQYGNDPTNHDDLTVDDSQHEDYSA